MKAAAIFCYVWIIIKMGSCIESGSGLSGSGSGDDLKFYTQTVEIIEPQYIEIQVMELPTVHEFVMPVIASSVHVKETVSFQASVVEVPNMQTRNDTIGNLTSLHWNESFVTAEQGDLCRFNGSETSIIGFNTEVMNSYKQVGQGNRSANVLDIKASRDLRGLSTKNTMEIMLLNCTMISRETATLCGYPPICDYETCQQLNKTSDPLSMCENAGGREIFIFAIVMLATFTVIGNCLLPIAVWRNPAMRSHHNALKVSLSISDLIVGIILISSVIPNIEMTMNSTENEIVDTILRSENTVGVVLSGSVLILSSQASLFHLTYLSIERFIAIQFPFWLRRRSARSVIIVLLGLWSLSVLDCLLPIIFNKHFAFQYSTQIFMYVLVSKDVGNYTHAVLYLICEMVFPFCVMVVFTMITACIVYKKQKSTEHMKNYSSGNATKKGLKSEISVFKNSVVMIVGFSVTVMPFTLVSVLHNDGYFGCHNAIAFAVTLYACLFRGFLNVIIYTVRDKRFRKEVKKIFGWKSWPSWASTSSQSNTVSSQV